MARPRLRKRSSDPRTALAQDLVEVGVPVASACGTCGVRVDLDDPQAVQCTRQEGVYPWASTSRWWRFHQVCAMAGSGPALLALMLNPDQRPLVVTQAIADVARALGVPAPYQGCEGTAHTDKGVSSRFQWVVRSELRELRDAVALRERQLTTAVRSDTGLPCAVCGVSHELADRWATLKGLPVCGACAALAARSSPATPGNRTLVQNALDAARPLIGPDRDVNSFVLARDEPSYRDGSARAPWAHVRSLPSWPMSPEQALDARLAKLEAAR